jgi:hypothetical protein
MGVELPRVRQEAGVIDGGGLEQGRDGILQVRQEVLLERGTDAGKRRYLTRNSVDAVLRGAVW